MIAEHSPETRAQAKEALSDLIRLRWERLAALVWRGYLAEGRGCVVLRHDAFVKGRHRLLAEVVYASAEGGILEALMAADPKVREFPLCGDYLLQELSAALGSYDPERELVALFVGSTGLHVPERISLSPPPPACYAAIHN